MGITKEGKVAVLTNYREASSEQVVGAQSRGVIVNSWLVASSEDQQTTQGFVEDMVVDMAAKKVGGFSLICGYVNEPLAIVSNRSSNMDQISWVATEPGQTLGLSNTCFDDRSWPKILEGERLTKDAIAAHVQAEEDEQGLINRLLEVLSTDTLPRLSDDAKTETYIPLLRNSIFVPIIGAQKVANGATDEVDDPCIDDKVAGEQPNKPDPSYMQGPYGTQKQTILLVSHNGRVRYFERTLYDNDVKAVPIGQGDKSFEFMVNQ